MSSHSLCEALDVLLVGDGHMQAVLGNIPLQNEELGLESTLLDEIAVPFLDGTHQTGLNHSSYDQMREI